MIPVYFSFFGYLFLFVDFVFFLLLLIFHVAGYSGMFHVTGFIEGPLNVASAGIVCGTRRRGTRDYEHTFLITARLNFRGQNADKQIVRERKLSPHL